MYCFGKITIQYTESPAIDHAFNIECLDIRLFFIGLTAKCLLVFDFRQHINVEVVYPFLFYND